MSKKARIECCIDRVSDDVMALEVFGFLEPEDVGSVALTCKWFYNLLQNDPAIKIVAKSCYECFVDPVLIDGNEYSAKLNAALIDWIDELGPKERPSSPLYAPSSPRYSPSSPVYGEQEETQEFDFGNVLPPNLDQIDDFNEPEVEPEVEQEEEPEVEPEEDPVKVGEEYGFIKMRQGNRFYYEEIPDVAGDDYGVFDFQIVDGVEIFTEL